MRDPRRASEEQWYRAQAPAWLGALIAVQVMAAFVLGGLALRDFLRWLLS